MPTIETFRQGLDADTLATVDALRETITASRSGLTERLKWNAPSFALGDDDRITLGLERKGGVRVVFHRGVKAQDTTDFAFKDPSGLAKWLAPDRGVVVFQDRAAVDAHRAAFSALCAEWLERTT